MVLPSEEVSTPKATLVPYCPHEYARVMAVPSGVVPASVTMMAPLIVTSTGKSWKQTPGFVQGCKYMGAAVRARLGYSVGWTKVLLQVCPQGRVQLQWPRAWGVEGYVKGALVGVPRALVS